MSSGELDTTTTLSATMEVDMSRIFPNDRVPVAVTVTNIAIDADPPLKRLSGSVLVACNDGAVCVYTRASGWVELPPIPRSAKYREAERENESQDATDIPSWTCKACDRCNGWRRYLHLVRVVAAESDAYEHLCCKCHGCEPDCPINTHGAAPRTHSAVPVAPEGA